MITPRRRSAGSERPGTHGRSFNFDHLYPRLPHPPHARRGRASAALSSWRRRRGHLAPVHGPAGEKVRRHRSRASGLRRLRYAAVARYHRRSRELLSRFSRSARPRRRPSHREFAWRLDRHGLGGAQRDPPGLAHPHRSCRHPCQGRGAGRHLPEQRGAAHPRPVLRSTARRGGHRGLAAAGAGRCRAQEPDDDRQAGVATPQPRSPSAQVAASDQNADVADLGGSRSGLSEGLRVCVSGADPGREGRHRRGLRAPAARGEGRRLRRRTRSLHRRHEDRSMKFFNFHLMPYRHADLDAIAKNGSAWVTFSNRHYDPQKGAELYHDYLDQMEFADKLGFDGVCLNEHHQTAYGMMPIPGVLAGALARSVKRAKLAILGRALPLLNNPLMVAEEYAMLDNLTRGRFIAGFVRGIGAEYHAMGINPTLSQERFAEAHDLIVRAWTEPGPFAYVGKHYQFKYVNPWPRPYQDPHPPIWIPSQGSGSTIRWAARMRYTYCQTLSPIAAVARFFQLYRDEADQAGYQASPDQLAWSNTIYVAETDEKAVREARPHLEALMNYFLKMPTEMLLPPGYTDAASMKRVRAAKVTGKPQSIEDVIKAGVVIVGSPNTVREKLAAYQDLAGFNTSLTKTQFGTLPDDMTRANMTAIAEEIIPHFRHRLPQGGRQAAAE